MTSLDRANLAAHQGRWGIGDLGPEDYSPFFGGGGSTNLEQNTLYPPAGP